jgi:O-antigen/teichoic acid export membrane protein
MQHISDKIIKNTIFNMVGNFGTTFLTLIIVPFIIANLGPERFGIWALVSVVFSVFTALDCGCGMAFVKYCAEYYTEKKYEEMNTIIFSGMSFMFLFSLLLLGAVGFSQYAILTVFHIPSSLMDETRFVFLAASIIFSINNVLSVFQAIIKGVQRMEITNALNLISSFVFILGIFIVLQSGWGLKGLILVQGIKVLMVNVGSIYYSKKLIPQLSLQLNNLKLGKIKEILDYGLKMQISSLAELINLQTDKTIIGHYLNLSYVTFYEIGQKLFLFCKMVVGVFLSALVPAISELNAYNKKDAIYKLYENGSKYLIAILSPLIVFMITCADSIIELWMGPGYEKSILVMRLLVLGCGINIFTGVGVMIVRGIGKPIYETQYALLSLISNIALGIILVKLYGFFGVIIATPISIIVGSVFFMIRFHRLYNIPLFDFLLKIYMKPIIIAVGLAFLMWYGNTFIRTIDIESRIRLMTIITIDGICYGLLFFWLLKKLKFWNSVDFELFDSKLKRFPFVHKFVIAFI